MSTIAHPLYNLLKNDVEWNWDESCDQAFQATKEALTSSDVLVHFDSKLPISMAGDASGYGIGAVISHRLQLLSFRGICRMQSETMHNWNEKMHL